MARTSRTTDDRAHSDLAADVPDRPPLSKDQTGLSDARIDSLVASSALPSVDEPIPENLLELAQKLGRALEEKS